MRETEMTSSTIEPDSLPDDSQYKYPLTNELDLSPCKSSSDYWNLEVSICSFYQLPQSYINR